MKGLFTVDAAIVLAFSISNVSLARGGHGGGHHGGGHRGGHRGGHHAHHSSHHSSHHHTAHHDHHHDGHHDHHHTAHHDHHHHHGWNGGWGGGGFGFVGGYAPFSNGWYGAHPGYWRQPGANAWAVASFANAAEWLGLASTTQPVSAYNPTYVNVNPSAAPAAQRLAAQGAGDANSTGDWLPLGVYTVGPSDKPNDAHVMQLAINRDGAVRGTYFDAGADKGKNIHGSIDRDTQRVAFTTGGQNGRVFETGLAQLTGDEAAVSVFNKGAKPSVWTMTRQEEPSQE